MSKATAAWKLAQYANGEKHKCWMCGCHLPYEIATVDHLKTKASGGTDAAYNLRLACYPCNQQRGNRPLTKEQKKRIYRPTNHAATPHN